ncbi:LCP family protein [Pseudolysinimonas sp.]|jgi:LCP family protein required for cell wall assembly|uniref:LCP family protein n=1 Tax=Pseudolysinimonas sp. TaxID=2680009 RepID=UPI0037843D87
MTKRAWWLVALNFLVPGSAQVVAGNRRLGRFGLGTTILLWALVAVAVVLALVARGFALSLITNSVVLGLLVALAVFYAVVWAILTLDTLRLVRFVNVAPGARGLVAALGIVSLVLTVGGSGFVAANSVSAIGLLNIFAPGPSQDPIDGRYNILLLGGDAGPDRLGLRPDSISVVSIEAATGAAVIFGIPRNMQNVPFADGSPLWGPFPNGYDCGEECLVSYLYTYGVEHPELYPDAVDNGSDPGIEAMRDAVEGITGLQIPNYVLIDMQGFAQLIDALGGVEIDVAERVPLGINGGEIVGYIEAGSQRMDGATALWYARSRYDTTDYDRMERQRQVQEALLRQMDPANVLLSFQGVSAAGQQVVKTDIPQSMLSYFVELGAKTKDLPLTKIDFVPPLVEEEANPDFDLIRSTVDDALVPYTPPTETPAG